MSRRPSIGSTFTIVPFTSTTSSGSENIKRSIQSLPFRKFASPIMTIFAPEKDKSHRIQRRGTFCTNIIDSFLLSPRSRFDASFRTMRSVFLFKNPDFASSRVPSFKIKSSGGRCVKVSVTTARSFEFI